MSTQLLICWYLNRSTSVLIKVNHMTILLPHSQFFLIWWHYIKGIIVRYFQVFYVVIILLCQTLIIISLVCHVKRWVNSQWTEICIQCVYIYLGLFTHNDSNVAIFTQNRKCLTHHCVPFFPIYTHKKEVRHCNVGWQM